MKPALLFGPVDKGKSPNVSAQRRLNCYLEFKQQQDKTAIAVFQRPGLVQNQLQRFSNANSQSGGIVRGMIVSKSQAGLEYLLICRGSTIAIEAGTGFVSNIGFLNMPTSDLYTMPGTNPTQPVGIADNGSQTIFVDGVNGYVVPFQSIGSATRVTSANFPYGTKSVCCVASRFFAVDPAAAGRFRWSNLLDGTLWDPLDFATAESNPDPLVACSERGGELLLWGSSTIEFWQPVATTAVVQRVGGAGIDFGLAGPYSIQKVGGGVAFVGRQRAGERRVFMLQGYNATPISSPEIDRLLNDTANVDSATSSSYTIDGHTFYCLNLPTTTLVYDLTTQSWSEFQTEGGRCAADYVVQYGGRMLANDYRDSRFYTITSGVYKDDAAAIVTEITGRHIFDGMDRLTIDEIQLDLEAGVGLTTGQGSDPQVMLQVSKDGGHTWGNEMWRSLGALGAYAQRVVWRRLGLARDFVYRFRISDPVKVVLLSAYVAASK